MGKANISPPLFHIYHAGRQPAPLVYNRVLRCSNDMGNWTQLYRRIRRSVLCALTFLYGPLLGNTLGNGQGSMDINVDDIDQSSDGSRVDSQHECWHNINGGIFDNSDDPIFDSKLTQLSETHVDIGIQNETNYPLSHLSSSLTQHWNCYQRTYTQHHFKRFCEDKAYSFLFTPLSSYCGNSIWPGFSRLNYIGTQGKNSSVRSPSAVCLGLSKRHTTLNHSPCCFSCSNSMIQGKFGPCYAYHSIPMNIPKNIHIDPSHPYDISSSDTYLYRRRRQCTDEMKLKIPTIDIQAGDTREDRVITLYKPCGSYYNIRMEIGMNDYPSFKQIDPELLNLLLTRRYYSVRNVEEAALRRQIQQNNRLSFVRSHLDRVNKILNAKRRGENLSSICLHVDETGAPKTREHYNEEQIQFSGDKNGDNEEHHSQTKVSQEYEPLKNVWKWKQLGHPWYSHNHRHVRSRLEGSIFRTEEQKLRARTVAVMNDQARIDMAAGYRRNLLWNRMNRMEGRVRNERATTAMNRELLKYTGENQCHSIKMESNISNSYSIQKSKQNESGISWNIMFRKARVQKRGIVFHKRLTKLLGDRDILTLDILRNEQSLAELRRFTGITAPLMRRRATAAWHASMNAARRAAIEEKRNQRRLAQEFRQALTRAHFVQWLRMRKRTATFMTQRVECCRQRREIQERDNALVLEARLYYDQTKAKLSRAQQMSDKISALHVASLRRSIVIESARALKTKSNSMRPLLESTPLTSPILINEMVDKEEPVLVQKKNILREREEELSERYHEYLVGAGIGV